MSLLVVTDVEKSFGADTLLAEVNLRLEWGRRLGLIGRNGCGKTTLLRILAGQCEPDRGTVSYTKGIRFGYLRQEQMVEHGWTVIEEAEDAFAPVRAMDDRLRELEAEMAAVGEDHLLAPVLEEYGLLHDRFEAMGGYDSLRDIPQVLRRLGFAEGDLAKPTARLSGGEKTRLALAKLLLSAPDILLLDEPTNHLDLAATEWLEDFLRGFGGALILVSHDRYFLDRVVTMIAELENSRLTTYNGNYSAYAVQRDERRARQTEQFEREQAEIKRLEEFFEKWKNTPTKRKQAQMRLRWAERIRENATERVTGEGRSMRAAVKPTLRSGDETVIIDHLTKTIGERVLFQDVSALIRRGQRVGIVGPNGAGKTTLVRILLGLERATSGYARFGANVTVGYFAQEASDLDTESTVLENLLEVAEMTPGEARNYLGRFLFSGDDVFRSVHDLSGGEKNKLSLARLTYLRPNLLVLDEPTNHLDIDSRRALTEMLTAYQGTMLVVSHDRYLLDQVTTHTLHIENGAARMLDGGYSACEEARRNVARPATVEESGRAEPQRRDDGVNPLTVGMNSFELSRARKRAVREVETSEKRVAELEDWKKRIEEALSAPMPGDDMVRLAHDYEQAQKELTEALDGWEHAVQYAEGIGAPL